MLLNPEALQQGLVITIVGMGVVFSFLVVMIFSMGIMSAIVRFLNKIFPEEIIVNQPKVKKAQTSDDDIMAAIAVAVIKNRF